MDDVFFRSELTWDGIIAIVAVVFGFLGTGGTLIWRRWRKRHPLRVFFSRDPYDLSTEIQDQRLTDSWQLYRMGLAEVLIKIAPHGGTSVRKLRIRLVERRWFSHWRLWRWKAVQRDIVHLDNMFDMLYENSSSPLYYFESNIEPSVGSFVGEYFDDHDKAQGVEVSAGSGLWIGLMVSAECMWAGRLEIDTVVDGQRIFERKPLRVTDAADADMALFSFGKTRYPTGPIPVPGDDGTTSTPPPSPPQSAP